MVVSYKKEKGGNFSRSLLLPFITLCLLVYISSFYYLIYYYWYLLSTIDQSTMSHNAFNASARRFW